MKKYYVNKKQQSNGDHEVHTEDCAHMPNEENRMYLGIFSNCHDAVTKSKEYYSQSNGCYFCSNECHTG